MSEFLSVNTLAKRLGIGKSTIWAWVKKGNFPAPVRLGAGTTRWNSSAIDAWVRRKEAE